MQTSDPVVTPRYSIILPEETVGRAVEYLRTLRNQIAVPGRRLRDRLHGANLEALTAQELLGELLDTKFPQIFAESAVAGDGSDWTLTELGLLGDVSIAMRVTLFDDGKHSAPTQHTPPFPGMLIFTPGALLRNDAGHEPADWSEVTAIDGTLSSEGFYSLYRRRLLPVLRFINHCGARSRSAFVTVPGLGCGQFAGSFRGQLGAQLRSVLERLLSEHGASLPNLKAVYFDPYNECRNSRLDIHGIALMVRPLTASHSDGKSQLCRPVAYEEEGDDFSNCSLFSIVAWDHVSWPGNDFFAGTRATDDGVKAAASSSMFALTGIEGEYDCAQAKYQPPGTYRNWSAVVEDGIRLRNLRLWNPCAVVPSSAMK
jgi:hypothetical protein